MPAAYSTDDTARRVLEGPGNPGRTAFQRDRARVLHSAALRRLGATTQVMAPLEADFPRTRLTHSLEVAQIARELGAALGCDPDLVETGALAHDLGHPPFGHNGEAALDEVAAACGGFEGNAQSFRVLTRLEAKVVDDTGRSAGVNLTRAALDAATKYPWPRREGTRKFGVYDDDVDVFGWVRAGAPDGAQCLEAQVMDWADDVAYSVHDLEDGLHGGLIDPAALRDPDERAALFALCLQRYAVGSDEATLSEALDRLLDLPVWGSGRYDGSHRAQVALKGLTSELIGRFCAAAEQATRTAQGGDQLRRYDAGLVVPAGVRAECAVLKAVTARYVMERDGAEELLAEQRQIVRELVTAVVADPALLAPAFAPAYEAAGEDAARLRVVIDQVASLTDPSALAWHARLCR